MTDLSNKELTAELKAVKLELANMNKRTGCPNGFSPVYKLAQFCGYSERVVKHVISLNPKMAKRTYSTKTGGQIVGCVAYKEESFKKALLKFLGKSEAKGQVMLVNGEFNFYEPLTQDNAFLGSV